MRWSSLALAVVTVALAFAAARVGGPVARRLPAVRRLPALRLPRPGFVLAAGAVTAVVLAAVFAEVLDAVVEGDDLAAIDRPVVAWIADHRAGWLSDLMVAMTDLGAKLVLATVVTAVAVGVAYRLRSWRPALLAALVAGGCGLLVAAAKVLIARDRPDPLLRVITETGYSFPSGHAASALTAFAAVAWLVCMVTTGRTVRTTAWLAAGLLTVAIGLSRVYLGVHYPSDVLGGWLLGVTWLLTVAVAARTFAADEPIVKRVRKPVAVLVATAAIAVIGVAEPPSAGPAPAINADRAGQIALRRAGEGAVTEAELERERGGPVWSVEVTTTSAEYDVDVDATTGRVLRYALDD
jgi:membrane-associated phospholipid phosphatase